MGELEFRYPHEFESMKEGFEQKAEDLLEQWKKEGYTHVRASLHTNQCVPFRKEELPSPQETQEHQHIYEIDDEAVKRAVARWYLSEYLFQRGGKSRALRELRDTGEPPLPIDLEEKQKDEKQK